jgi:CRISPR-associated protein Cas2
MARRRYLLAYDIRDPCRLRLVARCAEGYGDRVQYSVFICDLSDTELVRLKISLEAVINTREDSVIIIDLGGADASRFSFVGQHIKLPDDAALII